MKTTKEIINGQLEEIEQQLENMFEAQHSRSKIICSWEESSSKKAFKKYQALIEEIKTGVFCLAEGTQTFDIWVEGYKTTGEEGTAQKLGIAKGITFQEACKHFATESDPDNLKYWSKDFTCFQQRKLFPTKVQAQKSFD